MSMIGSHMRHDCDHCRHLEWGFGDTSDPEGWCCNKRDYKDSAAESRHLEQLESDAYRARPKRCHESKPTA
jgi:hypothetical protein